MSLNVPECPDCNEPLNGRECNNCGCVPHEVETVKCDYCDKTEVKEETVVLKDTGPLGMKSNKRYICRDCQD